MNSFKATAQGRAGAGFQHTKAGPKNILRMALSRSRLCLLLLLLTAPQAMAATASCKDGAQAAIDGKIRSVVRYDAGTYLFIDTASLNCGPLYLFVSNAGTCDVESAIHAEGALSQPKDSNAYEGWSLSDAAGARFASSFSCQ